MAPVLIKRVYRSLALVCGTKVLARYDSTFPPHERVPRGLFSPSAPVAKTDALAIESDALPTDAEVRFCTGYDEAGTLGSLASRLLKAIYSRPSI